MKKSTIALIIINAIIYLFCFIAISGIIVNDGNLIPGKNTFDKVGYLYGVKLGTNELAINNQRKLNEDCYEIKLLENSGMTSLVEVKEKEVKYNPYSDFYFTLYTNCKPLDLYFYENANISYSSNINAYGAFCLDLVFNGIDSNVQMNSKAYNEYFYLTTSFQLDKLIYYRSFEYEGLKYNSFLDFSNASVSVRLENSKGGKTIQQIDGETLYNYVKNNVPLELKDENGMLIRETGKITVEVTFLEFITYSEGETVYYDVNFNGKSHVINANIDDYNHGLLIPTQGLNTEVYTQVGVVNDESVFVYSKESKIKLNEKLKLSFTHSPYIMAKSPIVNIYYYDSRINNYELIHTEKIFDKDYFDYIELDITQLLEGIYRIEIEGIYNTVEEEFQVNERYEYYFEK